jgi:iron complex outermembrane receptor protein
VALESKISSGLTWITDLSSTYTRSINLRGLSNLDRSVGKQLPFTPEWNINFNNSLAWKRYRVGIHYSYTGERFVEANNELDPLPAFSLVNVSIASVFNLFEQELEGSFRVNNVFNVDYESFENRAMPGTNFEFTLQITIK